MQFNIFRRRGHALETAITQPLAEDQAKADAAEPNASAPADGFLTYALQLDAQRQIKGYKFDWRAVSDTASDCYRFRAVLSTVVSNLKSAKGGWRLGKLVVYLDATAEGLAFKELQALPPESVVLCLRLAELADKKLRPRLEALRAQGFGIMLCNVEALPAAPEPRSPEVAEGADASEEAGATDPFGGLSLVTHLDVLDGRKELVDIARHLRPPGTPAIHPIATRVAGWTEFDAYAGRRLDAFVRGREAIAAETGAGGAMHPESVLIIRVMQMIQRNEGVRAIEAALAHDEALTARLLQHINILAVGHNVEVHSLHHAVGLLGYAALFRWLSLLLATSTKASGLAYMTKKAIMRGRFVELMGQGMLAAEASDELFLAGMFSLIDRVLGVPMQEVLAKVHLPEPVQEAIRTRGGVYGPLVALAESCETDASEAPALAASIGLSAEKVNASHLSAIAWALDVNPAKAR
ncbi:EAL and HDOD domain-containing protein [Variovorax sp. YR216]|uniref:EAL and HDOD domain-containing protein n=1 Tax=Variovorax sp. YR216 TaxID=1882828 RepID=UPI002108BF19|nr:HDOD domain-containing protein [Variovorax sp. YR216]